MRNLAIYMACLLMIGSSTAVAQESIFGFDKIDFFQKETKEPKVEEKTPQAEEQSSPAAVEDEWTEPIVGPGGEVIYYTPPKEVRDFLNEPTEETGKAYLEWNLTRLRKLSKAQLVLREVAKKLGLSTSPGMYSSRTVPAKVPLGIQKSWKPGKTYLTFFLLKNCPACQKQEKLLYELRKAHPRAYIEVFLKGYSRKEIKRFSFKAKPDSGISEVLGINLWPTTLVVNKHGVKFLISGFISEEEIENLLRKRGAS